MATRRRKANMKIDQYSIEGVQRTVELLSDINLKAARPAIAKGMRKGLVVIRAAMRSNVSHTSVRNSIRHRFKRRVSKDILEAKVGANVGPPRPPIGSKNRKRSNTSGGFSPVGIGVGNGHWYALGTKQRQTKTGANRGVMPPNRYVKRGYAQAIGPATVVMLTTMTRDFAERVKKLRMKQAK